MNNPVCRLFRLLALLVFALGTPLVHATDLNVDKAASEVGVTFTQMNVPVDANFTRFDIQAGFDPASPADAAATVVIETASFDFGPGAEEYNAEVRKPEWFDTDQYPQARFEARGATPAGPGKFTIEGTLQIKGVTQPVKVPLTFNESAGQWIFTGELPIKRLDYKLGATEWEDTSIVANEVVVKFKVVASKP